MGHPIHGARLTYQHDCGFPSPIGGGLGIGSREEVDPSPWSRVDVDLDVRMRPSPHHVPAICYLGHLEREADIPRTLVYCYMLEVKQPRAGLEIAGKGIRVVSIAGLVPKRVRHV